jgi:regulator of replication initiation timing
MTQDRFVRARAFHVLALGTVLAGNVILTHAQTAADQQRSDSQASVSESLRELQAQVAELKTLIVQMRDEAAQSRAETEELRRELQATREPAAKARGSVEVAPATQAATATEPVGQQTIAQHVAKLEEDQQLLAAKIDEQYQTKVESASKYRVRFSGIVLFNAFDNVGAVDNQDFPSLAVATGSLVPGASFGGSLRQSEFGFEAFGPEIGGARTTADIQFDFGGGFPNAPNGITFGLARLRTGTIRLDWGRTSIVAGQDALFISPLAPTSLASIAEPALSYSGKLWSWTPQIRVEHRLDLSDSSRVLLQAGILESLSGETPASEYRRAPQIGQTTQPGYAARASWTRGIFGKPFTVGEGGYYARQDWGFSRKVGAWAATTDWDLQLTPRFDLSGEFYRGRAVGGLGGGIGGSVLLSGPIDDPSTVVRGLDSIGGWSQLKFRATSKVEFNGAFGQDNPQGDQVRNSSAGQQNYFNAWLARNQTSLINVVYHPRSDVVMSLEYRHLRTFTTISEPYSADHVNMSVGVLF